METATAGDGDCSTTTLSSSAITPQQPRQKPLPKRFVKSQIPDSILHNETLNTAVSLLPKNYNFEIHKLLHRVATLNALHVTLQFPDGLLLFSLPISDILLAFAPSVTDVSVLSDTSFGACCLDDLSAKSLGSDLLVHFGHSCLVPISCSVLPAHYVFVEITIDTNLLVETLKLNFLGSGIGVIILAGTIQFAGGIREAKGRLEELGFRVVVPQARPLSKGEVLGCTAPRVPLDCSGGCGTDGGLGRETIGVFVADGRFHMEAFMIANPGLKRVFRYLLSVGLLL